MQIRDNRVVAVIYPYSVVFIERTLDADSNL